METTTPDAYEPCVKQLALVRVQSANVSFGCMSGTLEGTDVTVTVKLVSHRRQRLLGGWPRVGDLVGAEHLYHSVYEPRILICQEDLQLQKVLRRFLPHDLTEDYFSIRKPLTRVEGNYW